MLTNKPILKQKLLRSKKYKLVFNKIVIIVYGHSPCHLNVTGLKSKTDILNFKCEIENMFDVICSEIKLDNIFYSHKDYKNISLWHLFYFLRGYSPDNYVVDYNVELFPGMYLKSQSKDLPTLILFSTGSYSVIGAKSFESVKTAKQFVNKLYSLDSILTFK